MYTAFVAWVYGVTFLSLIGYVAWMFARLRREDAALEEGPR